MLLVKHYLNKLRTSPRCSRSLVSEYENNRGDGSACQQPSQGEGSLASVHRVLHRQCSQFFVFHLLFSGHMVKSMVGADWDEFWIVHFRQKTHMDVRSSAEAVGSDGKESVPAFGLNLQELSMEMNPTPKEVSSTLQNSCKVESVGIRDGHELPICSS